MKSSLDVWNLSAQLSRRLGFCFEFLQNVEPFVVGRLIFVTDSENLYYFDWKYPKKFRYSGHTNYM